MWSAGRLHPRAVVGVVAPALRRAVEDVLAEVVGRLHVHHLRLLGERRHLAFLAARVLGAAAAVGTVAGEAAELAGEPDGRAPPGVSSIASTRSRTVG